MAGASTVSRVQVCKSHKILELVKTSWFGHYWVEIGTILVLHQPGVHVKSCSGSFGKKHIHPRFPVCEGCRRLNMPIQYVSGTPTLLLDHIQVPQTEEKGAWCRRSGRCGFGTDIILADNNGIGMGGGCVWNTFHWPLNNDDGVSSLKFGSEYLSEFFARADTDLCLISHHSTSLCCNSPISFDLDLRFLVMP